MQSLCEKQRNFIKNLQNFTENKKTLQFFYFYLLLARFTRSIAPLSTSSFDHTRKGYFVCKQAARDSHLFGGCTNFVCPRPSLRRRTEKAFQLFNHFLTRSCASSACPRPSFVVITTYNEKKLYLLLPFYVYLLFS